MRRRLLDALQLDRTLAFALAARIWQSFSGPITIAFLIGSLTLSEQGVYYACINIIGIQAFFELGLLNVLISHVGHEAAALRVRDNSSAEDHDTDQAAMRLGELMRASSRWFGGATWLFLCLGYLVGGWALSNTSSEVAWVLPFACLVPLAAIMFYLSPWLAILEGAGHREAVYRFRLEVACVGSFVAWLSLAAGLKLWALVLPMFLQAGWGVYLVFVKQRQFFWRFRSLCDCPNDFSWAHNVLPMQWRMAAASLAAHLATQYFTLIVLTFHSDEQAAPLGMTLSVTTAVQTLAMAWTQTKFALVAAYHGGGDRELAGTIWRHTAVVSTLCLCVALTGLCVLVWLIRYIGWELQERFLTTPQIILLSIGCIVNHGIALQGFYVLSRRSNPLVVPLVVGYLSTAIAVWSAGYWFAANGVLAGYAITLALVALPLHTWAYIRFRSRRAAASS